MAKTDSTRKFNGKTYYYFCWLSSKSDAEQIKRRAKLNNLLVRVTEGKEPMTGRKGYNIWTRGPFSR